MDRAAIKASSRLQNHDSTGDKSCQQDIAAMLAKSLACLQLRQQQAAGEACFRGWFPVCQRHPPLVAETRHPLASAPAYQQPCYDALLINSFIVPTSDFTAATL
jgi:hypothetical protein